MNITTNAPTLSISTVVNLPTESLRRENNQREMIAKPAALSQSAAEKGVASEKDRGKTPAQSNEKIDFVNIQKQAEQENSTINDSEKNEQGEQNEGSSAESGQHEKNAVEQFNDDQVISELKSRDREVRSHELAHAAVGGASTGAPSYSFETGPDGKKYAVEGEVSVDLSTVKDNPRATIAKMQKVHSAALAPANPSVQDTRVAASAAQAILQAQSELLAEQSEFITQSTSSSTQYVKTNEVFQSEGDKKSNSSASDFDTLINQTLESQEQIAPSRSNDVDQRALRIESFYLKINQAYEKPPSYQFELTA